MEFLPSSDLIYYTLSNIVVTNPLFPIFRIAVILFQFHLFSMLALVCTSISSPLCFSMCICVSSSMTFWSSTVRVRVCPSGVIVVCLYILFSSVLLSVLFGLFLTMILYHIFIYMSSSFI